MTGFTWGAATAAYQIEGAVAEDGRTASIWDTYSHTPGRTAQGATGDIACDHYHRLEEDLDLMAELGLQSYRFSISWSRVQPHGTGELNSVGVGFYRRLADGLRARGITPYPTLYHWDLPQELEDQGGWAARSTAEAFGSYAEAIAAEFTDVDTWMTLNEPWCSAFLGYASGVHAPGRHDPGDAIRAMHHLNVGHTLAQAALRAKIPQVRIGAALNLRQVHPGDPGDPADLAAAQTIRLMGNEVFNGPMLDGGYDPAIIELVAPVIDLNSLIEDGDFAPAGRGLDFIGVNYYYSMTVSARRAGSTVSTSGGHGTSAFTPWVGCGDVVIHEPVPPLTQMGWDIDPAGLRDLLLELADRYQGVPLVVTENGMANPDVVDSDDVVRDQARINYIDRHLEAVKQAIEAGAPVQGYFYWSLLDNFEWAKGYAPRFGLIHVDFDTQRRVVKDSGRWYADVIRSAAGSTTPVRSEDARGSAQ
ncbi:MAG: beta-glucosidase [Propionibacteriaceae bacterium]|jgi:beta-glucosidase|nr:beta-glucosidase [Propionibacteriaceae bacterium]